MKVKQKFKLKKNIILSLIFGSFLGINNKRIIKLFASSSITNTGFILLYIISELKKFLINYESFFYQMANPIMTKVKHYVEELVNENCKSLNAESFSINSILS